MLINIQMNFSLILIINDFKFSEGTRKTRLQSSLQNFNNFQIIPQFCFNCYKIQIITNDVLELVKLYFLFNQQFMKKSNLRNVWLK